MFWKDTLSLGMRCPLMGKKIKKIRKNGKFLQLWRKNMSKKDAWWVNIGVE
jgi:hypothetical protein